MTEARTSSVLTTDPPQVFKPASLAMWLAVLLLSSGLVCRAHAERLPTTVFTMADGLPHRVVTRIVADSRGFLWVCSRRGLSRFDGGRFFTYGSAEGLTVTSVNDFLETSRGEYWVATNGGGVCRLNTSRSTRGLGFGSRFSRRSCGTDLGRDRWWTLQDRRKGRANGARTHRAGFAQSA
jgi:hypothetical protein